MLKNLDWQLGGLNRSLELKVYFFENIKTLENV